MHLFRLDSASTGLLTRMSETDGVPGQMSLRKFTADLFCQTSDLPSSKSGSKHTDQNQGRKRAEQIEPLFRT